MIRTTVEAVMKQPFIIITIGIIMLLLAVFNALIPVMAMIIGVVNMAKGGFFDSVLAVMQMFIDPQNIPMILISLVVISLILSVAVGLLLPGYLLIVNDGLSNQTKKTHLFIKGIKKYFFKFFLISIRSAFFTVILAVFILVSSVPAIVVTRIAMLSKPNLMLAAVFIDVLTVCVFFFSLSFYTIYTYMWYIASLTPTVTPFKAGKAVADRCFWRLAGGLLVFDIIFAVGLFAVYMIGSQIFRYITGWIFTTGFFTSLAVFLMENFRDGSQVEIVAE